MPLSLVDSAFSVVALHHSSIRLYCMGEWMDDFFTPGHLRRIKGAGSRLSDLYSLLERCSPHNKLSLFMRFYFTHL